VTRQQPGASPAGHQQHEGQAGRVVIDKATTYPIVLDDLLPAVWHHTEQ